MDKENASDTDRLSMAEIYEEYCRKVKKPRKQTTTQKNISSLRTGVDMQNEKPINVKDIMSFITLNGSHKKKLFHLHPRIHKIKM